MGFADCTLGAHLHRNVSQVLNYITMRLRRLFNNACTRVIVGNAMIRYQEWSHYHTRKVNVDDTTKMYAFRRALNGALNAKTTTLSPTMTVSVITRHEPLP